MSDDSDRSEDHQPAGDVPPPSAGPAADAADAAVPDEPLSEERAPCEPPHVEPASVTAAETEGPRRRSRDPSSDEGFGAGGKLVAIMLGILVLCLGTAVAINFFIRRSSERARQQPAGVKAPGRELDLVPEGTVRRRGVTRLQVPRIELPAGRESSPLMGPPAVSLTPLPRNAPEASEALAFMASWQKRREWRDRLPLTLRHDRSEEMMRFFYEQRRASEPDFQLAVADAAMLTAGGERIIVLLLPSRDRADGFACAYLHRTIGGELRLDWDSFVGFSDLAWPELRALRPSNPVLLRCYATLDDYHNFEFADAKRFLSLKLRSPDGQVALSAFCPRDTAMGHFLQSLLKSVPDWRSRELPPAERPLENLPVVLSVRFPRAAQSNHCVELLEAVAGRWLLFDGENALTARQTTRVSEEIINNLRNSVLGTDRGAP